MDKISVHHTKKKSSSESISDDDKHMPLQKIPMNGDIIINFDKDDNKIGNSKNNKDIEIGKNGKKHKSSHSSQPSQISQTSQSSQTSKPKQNKENEYIYENLSVPWNMRVMVQLKKIGEKSIGYKWMHEQEIISNEKWKNIYSILEIVILAIITTVTGGEFIGLVSKSGIQDSFGALVAISAVQLGLSFCYALIKGLKDYGNYDSLIIMHRIAKLKFNEIYYDVEKQFSKPIEKRCDGDTFLEAKTKEFNDLMFNSPLIDKSTMKKYVKATANEDIYKPVLVGQFDRIEIVIDQNDNKIGIKTKDDNMNTAKQVTTKEDDIADEKIKFQFDRWLNNF